MAYDIFTNIQGPAVPVSLYGEAATAGINAGNALPTQLTAGIQGAIKGVAQGQEIYANEQQQEIRQNQIDQLPITNQIQEAQLESMQTQNKIMKVRADIAANTKVAATEETLAQLNYQKEAYQHASENATQLANYSKEAGELDPVSFKNNVLGGKYDSIYADNPKAYEKALKDLYINQQKNGLAQDPITLGAIGTMLKRSNAVNSLDKLSEQNRQKYVQNEEAVFNDGLTNTLSQKLEGDPRTFPNRVRTEQQGKYLLDPTTHAILKTNSGQFVENTPANKALYGQKGIADFDAKTSAYFTYDPKTGEVLVDNVSKESKALYDDNVKLGKLVSGETARQTSASIGNDFRNELNKARETATPAAAKAPGYGEVAQKTLGVSPEAVAAVEPSLKALDKEASVYVGSPESRNSPAAVSTRAATIRNTAKAIAKHNFDANPDLKNTYNDNAVFKWNKELDSAIADLERTKPGAWTRMMSHVNPLDFSVEMYNYTLDSYNAQKVSNPFELYYVKQGTPLEKSVEDLFGKLTEAKSLVADKVTNNMNMSAVNLKRLASIPRQQ